ncbi:carbohydrate kinase [Robiginitalea sp. M366]|uniref:carbohydrate kinase family protein n=1 Tax=Robiginitalea aestuariiviva TaxID=3036903 RepID=UPI00240D9D0F|nr:carbohydrate kinase [Robiginitalea aestuariiviva]MDG1571632.1 carbohydrate kinase [Robiginitalea aestuariiviva]
MRKVFCIGELLIDFVAENQGSNLSRAQQFTRKAGGAPANVAAAISKLGGQSAFIGCVGEDPFGTFLQHTLESQGADTRYLQRSSTFTTMAFVSIAEDGERDFVFSRGADRELKYLPSVKEDFKGNLIHLGAATALLGGPLEAAYNHYFFDALTCGAFISFDPNFRQDLWKNREADFVKKCTPFIEKANLCKFSLEEAQLLSGAEDTMEACNLLHQKGVEIIVVTLGKDGTLLSMGERKTVVPSIPVKAVDTTGAGDAFIGCLLQQLARTDNPLQVGQDFDALASMVRVANAAGALTTTGFGAIESLPDRQQLQQALA